MAADLIDDIGLVSRYQECMLHQAVKLSREKLLGSMALNGAPCGRKTNADASLYGILCDDHGSPLQDLAGRRVHVDVTSLFAPPTG